MIDTLELLNRLYKRAEEGYYEDKPPFQFSKDELNLMYDLGWVDEASYQLRKQRLEQLEYDEYCRKRRYLFAYKNYIV